MTNRTHPPTTPATVVEAIADSLGPAIGNTEDPLALVAAVGSLPTTPERLPVTIDDDVEVYALQMAGYTPYQIALKMTQSTKRVWSSQDVDAAARRVAVDNAARSADQTAFAAQLDLDRIDSMIRVLWPQVQDGNHAAIDRVEKLMRRRSEMLGLDAPDLRLSLVLGAQDGVDLTALSTEELQTYRVLQRKATTAAKMRGSKLVRGRIED